MLLKPSQSLSAIEQSRAIIKDRIERFRSVYAAIHEYGITKEDYVEKDIKPILAKVFSLSYTLPENDSISYGNISFWEQKSTLEDLANCEKEIKLLKAFHQQGLWQKPKEETVASVKERLMYWSKEFIYKTNYFTMDLDKELIACDLELNKFKRVCETLVRYGVSDSDYIKIYSKYEGWMHRTSSLCSQIEMRQKVLDEALDMVSVIEAAYKDYKPYTKKWVFRIPVPMDENLKALLNGLLGRYERIVD